MARLGADARAAGTLRLSHGARNNRAIEGTRIISLARASNFANWTEPTGFQEIPDLVRDRETRLLREHCGLRPKHATHRSGGAVQPDSGQLSPRHLNIANAYWSSLRVRRSNRSPSRVTPHSPSLQGESDCRGMLAGRISNICKWFANADSEMRPLLAGALRFHALGSMTRN